MIILIVMIILVILAIFGAPLFTIIGMTSIANFLNTNTSITVVAQEITKITKSDFLFSIPLFTFAGYVLAKSNASKRLVRFTKAAFGWMPGGLALVTLLTCAFFTAFTGASGVTIVALGGFLLPALLSERYKEKFSLGLVTSSGSIGLLFPPSLPIIIFGVISGASIDKMFTAGIMPGILIILIFFLYSIYISIKCKVERTKFVWKEFTDALWEMRFELPLPILLFSGIYTGFLVISDAATFTVLYILVVEVLVTKDVKFKEIPKIMKESMTLVGVILVILGVSFAANNYFIDQNIPQKMFEAIQGVISNKWTFLIVLNIFLLIVGCLMDIFSALVVIVPLIIPIAEAYNINIIHLGIIFLANLEIGYLTPPVGMNLFISSIRFGKPVVDLYKAAAIFIVLSCIALIPITYLPELSTWFIEKPSLVNQWEYKNENGQIDHIDIYAGGRFIRSSGANLMELMTNPSIEGCYSVNKDLLIFQDTSGNREEYQFEIFNDGKRLLLIKKGEKKRVFYENFSPTPINDKMGRLITEWKQESGDETLEFKFNQELIWCTPDEDKDYFYRLKGNKIILTLNQEDDTAKPVTVIYNYKFENENKILILNNKNSKYRFIMDVPAN